VEDVFRSNVDAVIIATPVRTHYQLAKDALLHDKHVLVEKPLTTNVAEAEELIALAAKQKCLLTVGHTFLYSPAVSELAKIISAAGLRRKAKEPPPPCLLAKNCAK
jgi:predicted dehydrogenase